MLCILLYYHDLCSILLRKNTEFAMARWLSELILFGLPHSMLATCLLPLSQPSKPGARAAVIFSKQSK
jgi:hypothetical protein